jgi:hypothetical protein
MDQLHTRVDALEHQLHTLHQQTRAVERRLRWWRGLACGLVALGLLGWVLQAGHAADAPAGPVADRLTAVEAKLVHLTSATDQEGHPEVVITGANLRIVNGLEATGSTNGLGNLIVGYNEPRGGEDDRRTGSHNVVVGALHNFSRFGGLVVGYSNEITGENASVCGGIFNTASGVNASVSAGYGNTASGNVAVVSAGDSNTASIDFASVSGGNGNTASGTFAVVSGGGSNTASGLSAVVSGGLNRTADGEFDWVAGPLFADE